MMVREIGVQIFPPSDHLDHMNPTRRSPCGWPDVLEAHVLMGESGGGEGSEVVNSYQSRLEGGEGAMYQPLLCRGGGRGGHRRAAFTGDTQLLACLHQPGDPGGETGPGGDGVDDPPR